MTDTTTATTTGTDAWQALLQQADDALARELLCVQRRYHGTILSRTDEADGVCVRCFMSLSDPDLAPAFKGESEILVTFPPKYPDEAVRVDLCSWQHRMSDKEFTAVEAAVSDRANELRGTYGIRKLLTWLDNNILRLLQEAAPPVEAAKPEETQEATQEEETQEERDPRARRACRFMLRGMCKSGDKCKFSHEKAKELRKKKEKKQQKQAAAETSDAKDATRRSASPVELEASETDEPSTEQAEKPDSTAKAKKAKKTKPKKPAACKFFAKGACRDGDNCKFSHETKPQQTKEPKANILNPAKKNGITIAVIGEVAAPSASDTPSPSLRPVSPPVPEVPLPRPEDWTSDQQKALDAALKKYPATMEKKERWLAIAGEVEGKTLNDCIDRFKLVSQLVKDGEPIPIASVVVVSPPMPVSPPRSPQRTYMPMSPPQKPRERLADPKDEELELHAKITPDDRRLPIETEPTVRGTEVRLEELFLYEIGTLVPHCLVCQVQCMQCPLKFDARLTLDRDSAAVQKWCPRCSVKHVVTLRPVFTHAQSNVLAYIDTENCAIVDVLPSDVLASCLECGLEALLEKIVPGRRAEQACFSCHTKLAMMTKRVAIGGASEAAALATTAGSDAVSAKTKKARRVVDTFVPGQPLPRNGVCDHYKHSHRWFRFQCCGKAFPCDVCHDASDCEQANTGKIASKIICGFCSKEQSSAVKECACGNEMGRATNRSRHWEGGSGCRDPTRMSTNDRQKFRGLNKTESQKHKRVGAQGKQRAARASEA